ncbi:hypothetical protein PR003_g23305 [Phytophthora rubi]|uniref:RxLR effector protein n=1 Tax=Phytophthora rubi TaxID=129364 RepID=A0A6A3IS90_9STRA|nr:hypothetical protein PR002_g23557 [Phytophthora rubi]KAE9298177.1 hypothetical protein PR003_g23305 [Phytophthora rubi]
MQEEEERAIKLPGKSKFVKWLNPSTESKLPSADVRQIKKWVKNKNSEEDVFKRLELDSGMEKVLANAKLDTYAAYIDRFNKKNPDNKVSMIDMFTKTYGDDVVARALEVGADAPSTRKIASRLWRELLGSWKHNRDSADDIFKLLKLDEAGTDLFAMPQLNTWFIFTRMTVHDPKEEMVSVLAATYGYDGLSRIFLSATPRDTTMRFIALDLETAMGKMWLREGQTPDEIFKLLKLDGGVNSFVANPNVKTLSSYIDKFNVNADQPTTLVGVFKNFYGVKRMSEMLDEAKKVPGMETRVDKWKSQLASENLRARRIQ